MDYQTKDCVRRKPKLQLIGSYWQHYKNKKVYQITGFDFDSSQDLWTVRHFCLSDMVANGLQVHYNRPIDNFFSCVYTSSIECPRFTSLNPESVRAILAFEDETRNKAMKKATDEFARILREGD